MKVKGREDIVIDIEKLGDFSGTVGDLFNIVQDLKERYGSKAKLVFDAGYNNINCSLTTNARSSGKGLRIRRPGERVTHSIEP